METFQHNQVKLCLGMTLGEIVRRQCEKCCAGHRKECCAELGCSKEYSDFSNGTRFYSKNGLGDCAKPARRAEVAVV